MWLLCLRLLLWFWLPRFDPRPRNFSMPWVQLKNKQLRDINDRMTETEFTHTQWLLGSNLNSNSSNLHHNQYYFKFCRWGNRYTVRLRYVCKFTQEPDMGRGTKSKQLIPRVHASKVLFGDIASLIWKAGKAWLRTSLIWEIERYLKLFWMLEISRLFRKIIYLW